MAKLGGGQTSETHELIDTKFGVGDYVSDITLYAIIQSDRSSGGSRHILNVFNQKQNELVLKFLV